MWKLFLKKGPSHWNIYKYSTHKEEVQQLHRFLLLLLKILKKYFSALYTAILMLGTFSKAFFQKAISQEYFSGGGIVCLIRYREIGLFNDLSKKEAWLQLIVGNHEYRKTDGIHSVQTSLKSHPLWVNL